MLEARENFGDPSFIISELVSLFEEGRKQQLASTWVSKRAPNKNTDAVLSEKKSVLPSARDGKKKRVCKKKLISFHNLKQ